MHAVQQNFCTNRGLIQHLKTCRRKQADNVLQHSSANDVLNEEAQVRERFYWKQVPGSKKYTHGNKWGRW